MKAWFNIFSMGYSHWRHSSPLFFYWFDAFLRSKFLTFSYVFPSTHDTRKQMIV